MRSAVATTSADAARLRLNEHSLAVEKLARQVAEQEQRLDEESAALEQLEDDRAVLVAHEHGVQTQSNELQERIGPAETELEASRARRGGAWRRRRRRRSAARRVPIDCWLSSRSILCARRRRLESLRGRIVDDFGLVSFEYAANVEGPVPLPFEGLVEQLRDGA